MGGCWPLAAVLDVPLEECEHPASVTRVTSAAHSATRREGINAQRAWRARLALIWSRSFTVTSRAADAKFSPDEA